MITLLLLFFFSGPALASDYPLPPPPAASTGTIVASFSADHLDYSSSTALAHLKGHAVVRESSWTIESDELWINPDTRRGTAPGFFIVKDSMSAVAGNRGFFDLASRQAVMSQTAAGYGDWRVHAREGVFAQDHSIDYYQARITSCDIYPNPHYYFYSTHATVVPNRYLLARNCVFYLGGYPLFYVPVFYKSLKPDNELSLFEWKAQPGYDKRNGYFVDDTVTSHWSQTLYTKAYVDGYSQQGVGLGGEIDDHESQTSQGTLSGYEINENQSPDLQSSGRRERWAVMFKRYQTLAPNLSFTGNLQALSDPLFNNDYSRASLYPFTSEINNNAALSYAGSSYTAHISYSRVDLADDLNGGTGTGFQKVSEDAPSLDIESKSFTIGKLPWQNTISGFQNNTFAEGQGFIQHSGGGSWQGTQTINLGDGVSLKPTASYSSAYYNKYFIPFNNTLYNFTESASQVYVSSPLANSPLYTNALINRYSASSDLHWQSSLGYWDAIYAATFRSRPGAFAVDSSAPDYGLEENLITVQDAFKPVRNIWVNIGSGYNLQQLNGYVLGFDQRLQPIRGSLTYTPKIFESYVLSDQYIVGTGNQSFVADTQWGDPKGVFVGGGAGYNLFESDQYYSDARFGWVSPKKDWRFIGTLYAGLSTPGGVSRAGSLALFDKELQIVKVWHDFITRAGFLWRPGGAQTARISVSLRLGHSPEAAAEAVQENYWESEWYPQRATDLMEGR